MSEQKIILLAKDRIAKFRGYQLFRSETGGWTRFDKLYDESNDRERKIILDHVALECILIAKQNNAQKITRNKLSKIQLQIDRTLKSETKEGLLKFLNKNRKKNKT